MNFDNYKQKYGIFFEAIANKSTLHPKTAITISYLIHKPELLKYNNFFNTADLINKKVVFRKYNTPILGIADGIAQITNKPEYIAQNLGALKNNPKLQINKIRSIFALV